MQKHLYIDASHPEETRVVLKSESNIEEYGLKIKSLNLKSNIYLGKVGRVEPSLQAAFIDFGRERQGFFAFNDIQSDYYEIPTEDKEELKRAEEKIREDLKESNENKDGETEESPDGNSNNELKPADVDQPDKTREKLKIDTELENIKFK